MIFLNRPKFTALAVIALVTVLAACEKDLTTIGAGVIGNKPFNTDKAVFDVFAVNKKIRAVRANQLPVYQLGTYNHPIYGKTEATITSQVQLPTENPLFGDARPEAESTPENETVDSVYLYIPFLTSPSGDADNDGVIDALDKDPLDPNSDTDGDGFTDNQEKSRGTDPLVRDSNEADGFVKDQFARTIDVDSIYGNRDMPFQLNLQRSTYFLRDLDPNTNFQEAQEYYSDQDFSGFLTDKISLDSETITISEKEILLPKKDDAATENINEAEQFTRLAPGIRVALSKEFFQKNILDREGSSELLTQANFANFLRGIHFSLEPSAGEELMMLFNLRDAKITISYSYTASEAVKNKELELKFVTQQTNPSTQVGSIAGNAVNSFINDAYPPEVADGIASEENAERIYLKGGAGSFAEIKLFDDANGRQAIEQIKANNWIINEANLVFYVDKKPGVVEPPRLYLYNTETNAPLIGRNDAPAAQGQSHLSSYPFYGGLLQGESSGSELKYTVKITDYMNDLVVRNADNATLGLTITPNIGLFNSANAMLDNDTETELPVAATLSPLGTVLFGSNVSTANAGKKLQLEIFYTESN
ncbi:protein of unknown function [Pricia antarctica]|uniref:DUF4270 domain-containing protein n=1 Tax=Pricia antarctica TaxID=641691 RepID=A0A1G6W5R3_9FLAO|nr:DUF4270 family protein [Pricia antarctica]SDD61033.1 protein of unknown function [Pricia antarctica]